LAGVGAAVLWQNSARQIPKIAISLGLTIGVAHLGWQAWRASFPLSTSQTNPWVYAQTSPDILELVTQVHEVSRAAQGDATLINVIADNGDYWPLPWYLREFDQIGWWAEMPDNALAPIVIASPKFKLFQSAQPSHVAVGYFRLRPQVFLELYVERGLWEKYLKR
jgi:predicted membrane-bound mannosyltransferase